MAIDRLAYKLVMDHKQFVEGAVASRKELNLAKQVMFETQTPAQKYQKQLDSLGGLLKKGAIDQRTYNAAVKQLKNPVDAANTSLAKQAMNFIKLNPALVAAAAATAAFYAAQRIARETIGRVTDAIKGQFEEVDRLAKLSASLDIGTEELSTFGLIAGRAGTDIERFNKSLKTMQKNLGDARMGTGEAKRTLDELGVSVDMLAKLKPEQQFLEITNAISNLPTQIDKASAANAIFGRGSQDVLRLLSLSKEEFAAVKAEAESFGLTVSKIDAAGVEEANDAIGDLKAIMTGLARTAAVELAPSVAVAAEMIEEFALSKDGVNELKDAIKDAAQWLRQAAIFTTVWLQRLEKARQIANILNPLQQIRTGVKALQDNGVLPKGIGSGAGTDTGKQLDSFFDDFEKRVAKKRADLAQRFAGTDGGSLVGDIITGGKKPDKIVDDILSYSSVGEPIQRGLDDLLGRVGKKTILDDIIAGGNKVSDTRFAGAIAKGSQRDIEIRAMASRMPGTKKEMSEEAAIKSAELLFDAVGWLRTIAEKTEGVVVSELSELPT